MTPESQTPSSLLRPPPLPVAEQVVYFNSFGIATSSGDIMILLVRNGEPTVTINGSFTVIKSLANGLQRAIAQLEKAMSHEIMTVDEISAKLTENMQKDQK